MFKDQYGNNITAGSFITYPNRQGSSLWMNTAIVVRCAEEPTFERSPIDGVMTYTRKGTYRYLDAMAINERKKWDPETQREIVLGYTTRPARIEVLDRVTVVADVTLPPLMRDTLRAAAARRQK